jgi:hypothetical protein
LILARATPERYEELARTQLFSGEISWTAPSLSRGRLFARCHSTVACIDLTPLKQGASIVDQRATTGAVAGRRHFDLASWLGGEREYPYDPPDLEELTRWYFYILLGLIAPLGCTALLLHWAGTLFWPDRAILFSRTFFWAGCFIAGAVGTSVFNRFTDGFVFTWPLSLYVALHVALQAIVQLERAKNERAVRWRARLAGTGFIGTCLLYFHLCRRASLVMQWVFLLGFLPAAVASWLACRYSFQKRQPLWDILAAVACFSIYFWSVAAYVIWRMRVV